MANKAPFPSVVAITTMQTGSPATPSLNASYSIDAPTRQEIQAVSLYITMKRKFPPGQRTQAQPDASGKSAFIYVDRAVASVRDSDR
jgi:hypothetical protein